MRDVDAGLKLRGALLRLQALKADGFTSFDLSESANVSPETARDFLKQRNNPYTTEVRSIRPSGSRGRPFKTHMVTDTGRSILLSEIADAQRKLAQLDPHLEESFSSLKRAEQTISDIENADESEKIDLIEDGELELKFCRKELELLERIKSPFSADFASRLYEVERRFRSFVPDADAFEMMRELVHEYGCWANHREPADFKPLLVLFEGSGKSTRLSKKIITNALKQDTPVAFFKIGEMSADRRSSLFESVDQLRTATPLAGCKMVMTTDSATRMGVYLAAEFSARIPLAAAVNSRSFKQDLRTHRLRQRIIATSASLIETGSPTVREFFARCLAALGAIESYRLQNVEPKPAGHDPLKRSTLDAAARLMGEVVCVDTKYNYEVAGHLSGSEVLYSTDI